MHIMPLDDRILVRRVASDTAPSDIDDIANVGLDAPARGVVVAVGSGTRTPNGTMIPLVVTAGDLISFGRRTAQVITVGGLACWIMKAEDVLTIDIPAAPLCRRS